MDTFTGDTLINNISFKWRVNYLRRLHFIRGKNFQKITYNEAITVEYIKLGYYSA